MPLKECQNDDHDFNGLKLRSEVSCVNRMKILYFNFVKLMTLNS